MWILLPIFLVLRHPIKWSAISGSPDFSYSASSDWASSSMHGMYRARTPLRMKVWAAFDMARLNLLYAFLTEIPPWGISGMFFPVASVYLSQLALWKFHRLFPELRMTGRVRPIWIIDGRSWLWGKLSKTRHLTGIVQPYLDETEQRSSGQTETVLFVFGTCTRNRLLKDDQLTSFRLRSYSVFILFRIFSFLRRALD